jgi:hypothetical protein
VLERDAVARVRSGGDGDGLVVAPRLARIGRALVGEAQSVQLRFDAFGGRPIPG